MSVRRRSKLKPMIPLASMGDIAFLLIIFFMLTSSFMKNNQQLTPADSPHLESVENAQVSLTVDENGDLWLQGIEVDVSQVAYAVEGYVDNHPRDVLVHVNIDKSLTRKIYMPVMEALSESGVKLILTGQKANEP